MMRNIVSTPAPSFDAGPSGQTVLPDAAAQAGDPSARPPASRSLLPSLAITSMVLFATYSGLISVLLPNQVAAIDEANKVSNLAIVSTVSFIFTLFAQPLVGAFSDRTRSRMGKRAPWMIIGAASGAVFLMGLSGLQSILWIAVFWAVIQVSLNALQGPMTAIVPDRFPTSRRGVASAMVGIGTMAGSTVGVVVAGSASQQRGPGLHDLRRRPSCSPRSCLWSSTATSPARTCSRTPFSWKEFFAGFWINPKKNPDFAWAFAARFFFILGYFVIFAFQLFILTDYIGLSLAEANGSIGLLALSGMVTTLISIALGGWWSDKIGKRKIFIYAATVFMLIGLVFPLVMPNMTGMIIMSAVNGFGFGLYMACDTALMTEVLPGGGSAAGKDLGILNVATNIPQALSPAIAGILIGSLGGYPALFIFGMVSSSWQRLSWSPSRAFARSTGP